MPQTCNNFPLKNIQKQNMTKKILHTKNQITEMMLKFHCTNQNLKEMIIFLLTHFQKNSLLPQNITNILWK